MSNLRLAVLGWTIPAGIALLLGVLAWLDRTVPYPEPLGPEEPCYADEHDETVCPEPELEPESPLRSVVSGLAVERVTAPCWLAALTVGLGLSTTVVARTRKLRHEQPEEKKAFRLAVAALVLLIGVPLGLGLFTLVLIASFPIRG